MGLPSYIVDVNVTRTTSAVPSPSLATLLLLSPDFNSHARVGEYEASSLSAMAADLFGGVGSQTYQAAETLISQEQAVSKIRVGALAGTKYILVNGGTWSAGSVSMLINGALVTRAFSTDKATSLGLLCDAIEAATGLTATYTTTNLTNSFGLIILSKATPVPISVKSINVSGITGNMEMTLSTPVLSTFSGTLTAGTVKYNLNGTDESVAFNTSLSDTIDDLSTSMAANSAIATTLPGATTLKIFPKDGSSCDLYFDLSLATGTDTKVVSIINDSCEAIATALAAIQLANNDFYGLYYVNYDTADTTQTVDSTNSTLKAEQLAIAAFAQAQGKLTFIETTDQNYIDTDLTADGALGTPTIGYACQSLGYLQAETVYNADKNSRAGVAMLSRLIANNPGTLNSNYKSLVDVPSDRLSETQIANAFSKNGNVYRALGTLNFYMNGKTAGNEWDDVVYTIDWAKANIESRILNLFATEPIIHMTDAGIAAVKAVVESVGQDLVDFGALTPISYDSKGNRVGGFIVTVPLAKDVSTADKGARILRNVKFKFWLAGAINTAIIDGTVTY